MRVKTVSTLPIEVDSLGIVHRRAVVEMDGMIKRQRYRSPYVLISHIEGDPATPTGCECMLFLCEEDGGVLVWDELCAFYSLRYPEAYIRAIDVLEGTEWQS